MSKTPTPLQWAIGEWNGVRTDEKSGDSFPIKISVRSILGESGVVEEMEVEHDGKLYRALAITVFDAKKARWVMHYVNDVNGQFVTMEGELDGDTSVWRAVDPVRTREAKLALDRTETGGWRRTQLASEDGGETWFVIFTDMLRKSVSRKRLSGA